MIKSVLAAFTVYLTWSETVLPTVCAQNCCNFLINLKLFKHTLPHSLAVVIISSGDGVSLNQWNKGLQGACQTHPRHRHWILCGPD